MLLYILKRLIEAIPVCLGVLVIVSLFVHIIPGDPVDILAGDYASLEEKTLLRHKLGLDLPIVIQVKEYVFSFLRGDFGVSLIYQKNVETLFFERVLPTIELALFGILVAILLGIPLGIIGALNKDRLLDHSAMLSSLIGTAMPNFWLGPLLILTFSIQLDWFPVSERSDWTSYILPSLTLGLSLSAILSRVTRNSILDTIHQDFIKTSKAKGNSKLRTLFNHLLRNAIFPVVTILGLQLGTLMTGSVVTENIFDWPGLGSLLLEALQQRDYPVVQFCITFFAFIYICVNVLTDIIYAFLDPRVRYQTQNS